MPLNWKAKLTGKYTKPWGNNSASKDDLDLIAKALSTTKDKLLDKTQSIYQDIKIKTINAWVNEKALTAFQLIYLIDGKEITGNIHGHDVGNVLPYTLPNPSYLLGCRALTGTQQTTYDIINWIEFGLLDPTNNSITLASWGTCAGSNWRIMNNIGAFTSWGGGYLDTVGYYELEITDLDKRELERLAKEVKLLKEYWDANLKTDYGDKIDVASLTAIKTKLDTLKTANDTLTTLTTYWKDKIATPYGTPALSKEGIDKVDVGFTELKVIADLMGYWKQIGLDKYGKLGKESFDKIKNELDTLNANQEKHTPADLEKHTDKDLKPAGYDEMEEYWDSDLSPLLPMFKFDLAGFKEIEKRLKNEKELWNQQQNQGQSDQYKNKLLDLYKAEIKKRTELFYQDLSLDNNEVNEKYGNKDVSYLSLLDRLSPNSDIEAIINAFKITALTLATYKVRNTNDKYKDKLKSLPKNLKTNNLNYFKKVKDQWDLITEIPSSSGVPNPFWTLSAMEDDVNRHKQEVNSIIELWQA